MFDSDRRDSHLAALPIGILMSPVNFESQFPVHFTVMRQFEQQIDSAIV
jgi:hypothetical protein